MRKYRSTAKVDSGEKQMTIPLWTLTFLLFCYVGMYANPPGRDIPFNEGWRFCKSNLPYSDYKGKRETCQWIEVNLPHDWSIHGEFDKENPSGPSGGYLPGGIGLYEKKFQLSKEDKSQVISIVFDGVYRNSKVWLNGKLLGERPFGYIGFRYEINDKAYYDGRENELIVEVDNSKQPNSRWYTGSGIYRNVWLRKTAPVFIEMEGTQIKTIPGKGEAKVKLNSIIINSNKDTGPLNYIAEIRYQDKSILIDESVYNLSSRQDSLAIEQELKLKKPELWSVEHPNLYELRESILIKGDTVDQTSTKFGFRTLEFNVDEGFLLNGQKLKIRGVALHQDLGPLGAAINKDAIKRQLQIMKEMGVNAIRTAHNPPAPEFLDLTDEMGFLVMDESFDVWTQKKTEFDYSTRFSDWYERDLSDFIKRDRNHPSVFMWSIGNEIIEQWDDRGEVLAMKLANIVKKYDDTRPITAGMNPPIEINEKLEDKAQFKEYLGKPNFLAGSGALDVIGYNYAHQTYTSHKSNFPNTPFIASETTSALSTRGVYDFPSDTLKIWPVRWDKLFTGGNEDQTVSSFDQAHTPWGSTHEETWKIIKKHDYLSGLFVWTGIDYIGEPTPYIWPSRSSYFGIVDLAGFPKDVYYMYQSEWTKKDVLHVFPHWNWKKGQLVDLWAYYNHADEVELFINGVSQGVRSKKEDDLHVMWRVPFEPGEVKVVSREKGEIVKTKDLYTAGEPKEIKITSDRNRLRADGESLVFLQLELVDERGTVNPIAAPTVELEIKGDAKLIGVANGDPVNHQSFKGKQIDIFHGKALAVIQAGTKNDKIIVQAKTKDMKPSEIVITQIKN